jgi:hypothetical protein
MTIEKLLRKLPLSVQEIDLAMQKALKPSEPDRGKPERKADKSIADAIKDVSDRKKSSISDAVSEHRKAKTMEAAFVAKQQYDMLVRRYNEFMSNYLSDNPQTGQKAYDYISEKGKEWHWGDEVISYKERQEIARSVQMNALLGGSHNHVPPEMKEKYERWKDVSKFNMLLSFWMYDRVSGSS